MNATQPSPARVSIRTIVAVGAGFALTLAACSGSDDDSTGASAAAVATTESSSADVAVATTPQVSDTTEVQGTAAATDEPTADVGDTITIADFTFSGVTEVAVGTTVVVTNTDNTSHTWTAAEGAFDSGSLGSGDTFEFTFTEPGSFDYFCNFHPSMTGTIVVTA